MKILQLSDTHLGITKASAIKKMLVKARSYDFDIIVYCGDYCGGKYGHKSVKQTVKMIREVFPDKPFVTVIGNHDYWYAGKNDNHPADTEYYTNLKEIEKIFKENNVHFLDTDGVYTHPDFSDVVLCGATGWYTNPNPPTNDENFIPRALNGDTNRVLLNKANQALDTQVDHLNDNFDKDWQTLVFVTHFPVIKAGVDHKGAFETYSWSENIGNFFRKEFDCKYFLCGHAHKSHNGPLRYECGSDYYNPKFQIITV